MRSTARRAVVVLAVALALLPARADAAVTVEPPPGGRQQVLGFSATITGHGKEAGTRIGVHDVKGNYPVGCFPQPLLDAVGDWQCQLGGPFGQGSHRYEVRVFDEAGNQVGAGIPWEFDITSVLRIDPGSLKVQTGKPVRITGVADALGELTGAVTKVGDSSFRLDLACEVDYPSLAFSCTEPARAPRPAARAARLAALPVGDYVVTLTETDSEIGEVAVVAQQFSVSDPPPPNTPDPPNDPDPAPPAAEDDPVVAGPVPPPTVLPPSGTPTPPAPTDTPAGTPTDAPAEVPEALPPPVVETPVARPAPAVPGPVLPFGVALAAFVVIGLARGTGFSRQWTLSTAAVAPRPAFTPTWVIADGGEDDLAREAEHRRTVGWGDRSWTWRLRGHRLADRIGLAPPRRISPRTPLVGRLLADAAYLRAMLGILWLAPVLAAGVLGVVAVAGVDGRPLPPATALVVALLLLAFVDALAGAVAVLGYGLGVLVTGGFWDAGAPGLRGSIAVFLVMSLLWMALPLIGAAMRPFRRMTTTQGVYAWDRVADAVLAASLCGWLAYNLVEALPSFAAQDVDLAGDAGLVGWVTAGAVVLRVLLEEVSERGYPQRLHSVEQPGSLPEPHRLVALGGGIFRTSVFGLLASIFLGSCWELWAGIAVVGIWQLLAPFEDRLPKSPRLGRVLPRGLAKILVLMLVCLLVDAWATDGLDGLEAIRSSFVAMAAVPSVLIGAGMFAEEPEPVRWSWPAQLAGLGIFVACVVLTLTT